MDAYKIKVDEMVKEKGEGMTGRLLVSRTETLIIKKQIIYLLEKYL